jgi:hypothetical protein
VILFALRSWRRKECPVVRKVVDGFFLRTYGVGQFRDH